jgi:hypothetical protein
VTKKWYLKKIAVELYLDIQNVYDNQEPSQSLFSVMMNSKGQPIVNPSDPSRYIPTSIPSTSGIIQPALGLIISY